MPTFQGSKISVFEWPSIQNRICRNPAFHKKMKKNPDPLNPGRAGPGQAGPAGPAQALTMFQKVNIYSKINWKFSNIKLSDMDFKHMFQILVWNQENVSNRLSIPMEFKQIVWKCISNIYMFILFFANMHISGGEIL